MLALPAIDLRGGRVVQLVGGRPETERVSLPDALAVARRWVDAGFGMLHVIDLDAALGLGSNQDQILRILQAVSVPVQVGGGVRDDTLAASLLDAGAARVIVGTRAIEEPAWLADLAERHENRIVLAADVRDGLVLTRGWTAATGRPATEILGQLAALPLAAVLVTDVSREGQMIGMDTNLFATLRAATTHPLLAAGGVADITDLRALAGVGVDGTVLGMALYTGGLDAAATAREFG